MTFTPDMHRSNLRNSLSPYYCSIWSPDEVQIVCFLFLTQNHILYKSHRHVFCKEDTILLSFL